MKLRTTKRGWLTFILAVAGMLAYAAPAGFGKEPKIQVEEEEAAATINGEVEAAGGEKIPFKALTQAQLNEKVPNFYCFDYKFEPQPGKRYWIRVSKKKWIERYPDAMQSTFRVLGHATVEGTEGTLVVKISGDEEKTGTSNNNGLLAFIPDKGSAVMHHWYRNVQRGDTKWNDLGEMLSVE